MKARNPRSRRSNLLLTRSTYLEMVEQATVDAYGDAERVTGWFTMIEEHLEVPFETVVLGVLVTVERVNLTRNGDWIEAYRRWCADGHLPRGG